MANEAYIKNKKKYTAEQIFDVIKKEFSTKFHLDVTIEIVETAPNYSYVFLTVKELIIPLTLEKGNKRISLYDTPHTSFSKANDFESPYGKKFGQYMGMSEYMGAYSYLHQYLTHFLAKYMDTVIDSDGAGEIEPFYNPEKYKSYESWFKYWEEYYKNQKLAVRTFMTSPSKVKKNELAFFPELSF